MQALNLVTGHLDEVGGMMLTTPAVDAVALLSRLGLRGTYDRWRSRARQLPEFAGDLPVATLADEIEMDGPGRVRALVTVAGNPVLSAPNGRRLDRALGTLEHIVSHRWISERDDSPRARHPPARAAALASTLRSRAVCLLRAQRGEVFGAGHPTKGSRSGSTGRS